MDAEMQLTKIANKYNDREIWSTSDKWHTYTHNIIDSYVNEAFNKLSLNNYSIVLNAGSGGNNYGINSMKMIHVDIAKEKIKKYPNYILASVEKIPIRNNSVDACVCVGSVINYCNLERALSEIHRVLKKNSTLILEFEKTNSFDLLATKNFKKERALVTTFYNGTKEKMWFYNEKTVINILSDYYQIIDTKRFHLISPLVYRISKNETFSSHFSILDPLIRNLPILNKYSSNVILTCQKRA